MPRQSGAWNIRTSRQTAPDLEVLASPANADLQVSIVLDATAVASGNDGSRTLVAGTLLSKNGVSEQYERFTGAGGQVIRGVLSETIQFPDGTSKSDAPASMWNHGQEFRSDRIVDFEDHGAAAATALPTCRFV